MKLLFSFIFTLLFCVFSFAPHANASLSNKNQPMVAIIDLGSITADADVYGAYIPKKSVLVSAKLVNGASITSSDTDKALITLQNGSTVLATHNSAITGNTSALVANVPADMSIGSSEIPAGTWLKVSYDESGTYAMTSAKVIIVYYPL